MARRFDTRLWFIWVALAWAPFAVLWTYLLRATYALPLSTALTYGTTTIGWAAVLGGGVWWLTGRLAWPSRLRLAFYLTHFGLAATYSVLWCLGGSVTVALIAKRNFVELVTTSPVIGFQFVTGCWIYGLVAGLSYTVRLQELLHARERSAAQLAALAARARLKALRGQLRPHFLFNALHSVRALITIDPRTAELAVERLGEVLRYVLTEYARRDVVRLGDEWAFTRSYLEIERLRFEERLSITSDLPVDVQASVLPTFALQTLVENAVRHAVAPNPQGGAIQIRGRRDGATLVVSVRSDGAAPLSHQPGLGRGLSLLRRRMKELYGPLATLRLETDPAGAVTAELRVPQQGEPA
ncbi:MAG TPA: histidine kinase [Gemmatimonadales bacterium]|nr:histidine kinase [Gemmatimonadales bacterium]